MKGTQRNKGENKKQRAAGLPCSSLLPRESLPYLQSCKSRLKSDRAAHFTPPPQRVRGAPLGTHIPVRQSEPWPAGWPSYTGARAR